jgi:hypothetical protein
LRQCREQPMDCRLGEIEIACQVGESSAGIPCQRKLLQQTRNPLNGLDRGVAPS